MLNVCVKPARICIYIYIWANRDVVMHKYILKNVKDGGSDSTDASNWGN